MLSAHPRILSLVPALACTLIACGDDDGSDGPPADAAVSPDAAPDAAVSPDAASDPIVTTRDGQLRGTLLEGSRRFLGIPFAKPPVGPLRWKAPVPNDGWTGVRDAIAFSAACAQPTSLQSSLSENEDCLYLNVWTPDPPAAEPLPVMVWFHGGGNQNGSTADSVPLNVGGLFYDGRRLAAEGGVVVVTTNYRLGALGFFHHPALAQEGSPLGNQGLLDQRRALEWVQSNIEAFGGDPENVTIFGESAGALDVCLHLVSPDSRGLFHRAVSQSGGCTTRTPTTADLGPQVTAFAEAMGCAAAQDPLACLRDKPVADLIASAPIEGGPPETLPGGNSYQGGRPLWRFAPVVDGTVLPDQPRALFERGEVAQVPYLLGSNTDEGTFFHFLSRPVQTEDDFIAALERRFGAELAQEVALVYPPGEFNSPDDALQRVTGDVGVVCSTHDTARRAAGAGLPVWIYNFALPIPIPGLESLGATHGAEIALVFGSVESTLQETVGRPMRGYWSRFAATGDPNGGDAFGWPAFSVAGDQRINFNKALSIVDGFRDTECDFWRERVYDPAFLPPK